ncbi:hypothetical protein [Micromonospora sediminimaris]|uniref:Uncharacterized protein n=1 Tax=Micromonospora sediminimaris TaxID=547162 RepID=A0A9W5XLH2_9ACTN|nr:hypothetical protein [Micromonospora sediminimaris]GIJ35042.1 hypothetical protein Vse01_41900 [Micromonospora sediminimaris]SFD27797.1 hypothetical protein SAMN05216284_11447 [Micromonospora sediminimaris]
MDNSSYREKVAVVRRRKSYRLLVLSWRVAFLAVGAGAAVIILRENNLIGHSMLIAFAVPIIVVFCVSFIVVIVVGAIDSAHSSINPLGRGLIQRQLRFSCMFLSDLFTLSWRWSKNSDE